MKINEFLADGPDCISDLELVFDSHFSQPLMSESVLLFRNSMDSIPADKVL